jgi:hypothetical protein
MAKADSVHSTPPTNTSAIDHPMMFPPVDSSPWPPSPASSVLAPLPLLLRWTRASLRR